MDTVPLYAIRTMQTVIKLPVTDVKQISCPMITAVHADINVDGMKNVTCLVTQPLASVLVQSSDDMPDCVRYLRFFGTRKGPWDLWFRVRDTMDSVEFST
jgi:hypothetical protein